MHVLDANPVPLASSAPLHLVRTASCLSPRNGADRLIGLMRGTEGPISRRRPQTCSVLVCRPDLCCNGISPPKLRRHASCHVATSFHSVRVKIFVLASLGWFNDSCWAGVQCLPVRVVLDGREPQALSQVKSVARPPGACMGSGQSLTNRFGSLRHSLNRIVTLGRGAREKRAVFKPSKLPGTRHQVENFGMF